MKIGSLGKVGEILTKSECGIIMLEKTIRTFQGATAIVTGGASGIGLALAKALVNRGCEVVIADLQGDLAKRVAEEISTSAASVHAVELDTRDFKVMNRLVEDTVARTDRLDYIFNNAGIGMGGDAISHSSDDWQHIISINLRGVINGVLSAYPVMVRQGFGHIVNSASIAGIIPFAGMIGYTTTKHAVIGLSQSLRVEAALSGVRVSVLCPGAVRTPILAGGGKFGRILYDVTSEKVLQMWEKYLPVDADVLASKALKAVAKNRAIIVIPAWWKLVWGIHRLSPTLGMGLCRRAFIKMHKEFERS
jgi:NAD(P)-dependent dehydrogenase (short-subunit alcohol dehydrogenase family)